MGDNGEMSTTPPASTSSLLFADLGLAEPLVTAVTALGYEEADPGAARQPSRSC